MNKIKGFLFCFGEEKLEFDFDFDFDGGFGLRVEMCACEGIYRGRGFLEGRVNGREKKEYLVSDYLVSTTLKGHVVVNYHVRVSVGDLLTGVVGECVTGTELGMRV